MTPMPLGTLVVAHRRTVREFASALPDAPVVTQRQEHRAEPPLVRTRTATASVLLRAARRISPA